MNEFDRLMIEMRNIETRNKMRDANCTKDDVNVATGDGDSK